MTKVDIFILILHKKNITIINNIGKKKKTKHIIGITLFENGRNEILIRLPYGKR